MARTVIGKVKGDPGFSPTVNLNKEGDLLTISVVNETGTQSESIKTGEPVQSNWDTVDTTSLSYIKNKPDLGKVATTNSYADLDDIPTKLSQFSNDKQFITIDAVPTTLSSFGEDANHRTVTDAEKNEWSRKQNALSSAQLDAVNSGITKVKVDAIPSSYAPVNAQENVIEKISVNGSALTPSAKGVNITVPTKTSQLTNDSNYLTSHQDISGKVNTTDIVDSLTSTATNKPLSANQGKVLDDKITELDSTVTEQIGNIHTHSNKAVLDGITSTKVSNWDSAKTHADSTHARTDATNVSASTTNGNIKINGTETAVYTHPSGTNPHGTTKSDVGLGNVGNFKAVSTVASQGLTDTEKSNARANIGAGTSSFSGSYNDLSNKPTIPTVGNGTITITQNGETKGTFSTNQSGNTTIELTDTDTNTTYGVATSSALGLVKSGTDITVDSSGNVSVNDDSHNHVISNVDGLQTALDGKAASSHTHDDRYYTESEINTKLNAKLNTSLKGAASGLAELDSNGKVPSSQLPSYVDDVIEGYLYNSKFYKESNHTTEISGETGKIYIDLSTNKTYRWSGSAFVVISETLALGETSSTAYRGDRGKTAYDHSQSTHARTDATKVEKSTTNGNIKINGTETTVYTHPSGTNPHGTTKSDVGLGNVGNFKAVSTVANQGLTDTEKSNARANIGAGTSSFSGSYNDLSNKPTLGTASSKNIASSGNASTSQVVMGNDTRLTDSRKASDVYEWAKASTKPSYTASEVGLGNVPNVATNDQTPSYTEATTLAKLTSGEKLSVAFGKISKAITDLISHIGDSVKHITSTERTNWESAYTHSQAAHAPSNARANVIETVKVNGTALTPSNKAVDITVPTGAAADKGIDASIANGSSSTNLPTSKAVAAFVEGKGYKTTDTTYDVVTIEEAGLCPVLPSSTTKYLRGDGTWAVPGGSNSSAIVYNNNEPTELIDGMTWVGTAT